MNQGPPRSLFDAPTARLVRMYLERIARRIERLQGSVNYITAWRRAAQIVRESKPD